MNRCWETPLRSAGSPGSQNDPPTPNPHSSSRPRQQGHAVRPPGVLVSLDADRAHRGVWRILTRPQELHRCPRGPLPCAQCCPACPFPPAGQRRQPPTPHPPRSMMGRGFLSEITMKGPQAFPHDRRQVFPLSRPQCSHVKNAKEVELEIYQGCVPRWLFTPPKGQERGDRRWGQVERYREEEAGF